MKIDIEIKVGDIHWGVSNNDKTRQEDIQNFFVKFLIPLIKATKEQNVGKNIVVTFMGDWTDNKSNIKSDVSTMYTELLYEITQLVHVIMIVGNHDTPTRNHPTINTIKAFKYINNVTLVDAPVQYETCNGDSILYIPYVNDVHIIKSWIDGKTGYLRMHGSIAGFFYNGIPINDKNNLSISDFSNFTKVESGHIHKPDLIENCEYLGTPYQIHEHEYRNVVLGVHISDFTTSKNYFIENKISPKFVRIGFSELMNMDVEEAKSKFRNNYVSVYVPSNVKLKINVKDTTKILSEITKSVALLDSNDLDMESKYVGEIGGEIIYVDMDIKSKFYSYVSEIVNLPVTGVVVKISDDDKERLTKKIEEDYEICSKSIDNDIEI